MKAISLSSDNITHFVFGYGSLIWLPGFPYRTARLGLLRGAHRSLCIYSHRHRGTPEAPGLVFGLTQGGSCHGMVFEVAPDDWSETREYLREREQVTGVYREASRSVRLADGSMVRALVFLVDPSHPQYAGRLDVTEQIRLVRRSTGGSGPNLDYVVNTARHLEALGITDPYLSALALELERPMDARG